MNRRAFLTSLAYLPFASLISNPSFSKEEWEAIITVAHYEFGFTYCVEPDGRVAIDNVNRERLRRTLALPNLWEEVRRIPGLENSISSRQIVLQKL